MNTACGDRIKKEIWCKNQKYHPLGRLVDQLVSIYNISAMTMQIILHRIKR